MVLNLQFECYRLHDLKWINGGVNVIILLTLVMPAEVQGSIDKFVDKLIQRMLRALLSRPSADLDETTLGKPYHFKASPLHSRPALSSGGVPPFEVSSNSVAPFKSRGLRLPQKCGILGAARHDDDLKLRNSTAMPIRRRVAATIAALSTLQLWGIIQNLNSDFSNTADTYDRSLYSYIPSYCQENVWRFLNKTEPPENGKFFAVVIDEPVMWYQRSGLVWFLAPGVQRWSFHAIAILDARTAEGNGKVLVFDLESTLPFPCEFEKYFSLTFRPELPILDRRFRVIPQKKFLQNLPPDQSESQSLLNFLSAKTSFEEIVSMDTDADYGTLLSQQNFFKRFSDKA